MMDGYISTSTVALLTGEAPQRIREKVTSGKYESRRQRSDRGGGNGGESYLVAVSSLPHEAQIKYLEWGGALPPVSEQCDLAAYREKFGEAGLAELLDKQRACKEGLAIRRLGKTDCVEQLTTLASEHGVSLRSLYRWMDGYEEKGLPGIMRTMKRKDKGSRRSICPAAYQYVYGLYCNEVKRTQATVYGKLVARAQALGPEACKKCMFCEGTDARRELMRTGEINHYPPCTEPVKEGMRVPECRQTISRLLAAIPADEQTLSRRGLKAFKDDYMLMGIRQKPEKVNEVWFGDHHQFDCFVLDETGHPARPWLTAWYDAASGSLVGWLLCKKPNTHTIIEAFIRGVAYTMHSPFHGLPAMVYVDNGKDYRGKLFETGQIQDINLGRLNTSIDTCSVLQLFNISVTHALPYQGWSKPVERFFGTLEDIWIRDVPGWCGDSPDERPEDFSCKLRLAVERGELWTMDQLYEYLRDEVFPAYHNRPHEGYGGRTPAEMYSSLPRIRDDEPSYEMLGVLKNDKTTRQIGQQGVRFKNELYWDDAMIGLAGKSVTVLYDPDDLSTVTIILEGRTLCEAAIHDRMRMVGEDADVVAAHMEKQKLQIRNTRVRIARASRPAFADEVDVQRSRGNITTLEYEKAARARKEKRAARRPEQDPGEDAVRSMLEAMGDNLLRSAR